VAARLVNPPISWFFWHGTHVAQSRPARNRNDLAMGGHGMDESQHPKGALLFMLVYLLVLTALWLNAYLRLWRG
jgi:hypothetical protein